MVVGVCGGHVMHMLIGVCDILYDRQTQSSCTIGTMTMCVVEPLIVCEPLYVTCV